MKIIMLNIIANNNFLAKSIDYIYLLTFPPLYNQVRVG